MFKKKILLPVWILIGLFFVTNYCVLLLAEDIVAPDPYVPPSAIEIKHIEQCSLPEIEEEDKERGYFTFIRRDGVYPSSIPHEEEIKTKIRTFASIGEYEPVTFSIYALTDLRGVKVTVTDLVDDKDNRISASNIDVRVVRCWPQRGGANLAATDKYKIIPELLEKREKVDIKQRTAKQYWLIIKVPDETEPGSYIGKIFIEPQNAPSMKMKLILRILPFKLLYPHNKVWSIYFRHFQGLDTWSSNRLKLVKRDLNDLKTHGLNSVAVEFTFTFVRAIKKKNGIIDIDIEKLKLPELIQAYQEAGLTGPMVLLLEWLDHRIIYLLGYPGGRHNAKNYANKEFQAIWKSVVKEIIDISKNKGWNDLLLFEAIDEPGSHPYLRKSSIILYKMLKDLGVKTYQTSDGPEGFMKIMDPWVDVRCYHTGFVKTAKNNVEWLRAGRHSGDIVWYYATVLPRPFKVTGFSYARFMNGFLFWKSGADGFVNFAYNVVRGSTPSFTILESWLLFAFSI